MNTAPAPLWTVAEVARFLAVSRSWVYQQVEAGNLPHLRIAGLRFDPEEVQRWAKGRRVASVTPLRAGEVASRG